MTRRLILSLTFLCALTMTAMAQNARKILDATAARMTKSGDVSARFKATQYNGTTPQGNASGSMLISGRKFKMTTDELITWYDGTTEWSLMKGSNEVNVSSPTEEEQTAINPVALVSIYKKGYRFTVKESTLRGRPTYVIYLVAKNAKAAFSYIIVDVDKANYDPMCIRAKKGDDWMRLSILSFQNGLSHPAATFTFPEKDYPGVEVIDLR